MAYSRSSYGPGNIATLRSGIGLTMGPTIGSNDPRIPLSGLGVLQRTPTSVLAPRTMVGATKVRSNIGQTISDLTPGSSQEVDMMDLTEPAVDETLTTDEVITPSAAIPTWVWVVGGVVGLGLIGGLAYVVLK